MPLISVSPVEVGFSNSSLPLVRRTGSASGHKQIGSSEESVGKFHACCVDLVPPAEQFGPAGENDRCSDERPERLFDGPSSPIARTETRRSRGMNRSMVQRDQRPD